MQEQEIERKPKKLCNTTRSVWHRSFYVIIRSLIGNISYLTNCPIDSRNSFYLGVDIDLSMI